MLVAARKSVLMDALSEALGQLDPNVTKAQILAYVPADAQKILASAGIRDEHIFPVPAVLERKPTLIGYYRLLLGVSQKRFYRKGTGMGSFKSMETRGLLSPKKRPDLEHFCTAMAENLAELVRQISPKITARDVSELPLLTLANPDLVCGSGPDKWLGIFIVDLDKFVDRGFPNSSRCQTHHGEAVCWSVRQTSVLPS
jgi:hypothetical protein